MYLCMYMHVLYNSRESVTAGGVYLEAASSDFGLLVCPQCMCQLIQLRGVAVDWGRVVGVCEDDLLCQAAHVAVAESLSQNSAC